MDFIIGDIIAFCAAGLVLVGIVALAIADWPEEDRRAEGRGPPRPGATETTMNGNELERAAKLIKDYDIVERKPGSDRRIEAAIVTIYGDGDRSALLAVTLNQTATTNSS